MQLKCIGFGYMHRSSNSYYSTARLRRTLKDPRTWLAANLPKFTDQGSHYFTDTKIQDFPGPPQKIFQDLFRARECLTIKKKTAFMYNIHSVVHCRKFSTKQNMAKFISIPHSDTVFK